VKTHKDSTFTSVVALSRGGKIVEVYTETEWRSKRHLAKEVFPLTAGNPVATYDLGLGAIKRGNMNDKLFEVPAQKWADITDSSKEFGVSIISECKYGWDKFDDNTLRLTLMHTPLKNYKVDSMQSMMDVGLNRYSYGIYSHKGTVSHDTQCEARDFVMPMASFICSNHEGVLGSEYSFGALSGNAIVRAIKKAENSDEIVIRINESEKKEQKGVTLSLNAEIESAREIYASEEHIDDVSLVDGKLVFDLKPYEIKTFALKIKMADAKSTTEKVDIVGNVNAFSTNAKPSGDLPVINKTIPQEITPDRINSNGIPFEFSNKGMLCGGQSLLLPTDTKKVNLLMASLNGDKFVKINDRAYKVNDIREYYAGWDLYDFKEVAFTKEGKLAYEFTHSHTANGDAQCEQLFFWNVEVDVADNKLTLPVDREILILAVTADKESTECALACDLYDKISGRRFDYKENLKEKITYLNCKNSYLLNDKGGALRHRNKGRRK
jgi:alpha-mannosidase